MKYPTYSFFLLDRRTVLHLGSGEKYDPAQSTLISCPPPIRNVVHDLEIRPWPLPNDHFQEVRAFDVIEHLNDVVASMEEIHRVCRNGAEVKITAPPLNRVATHSPTSLTAIISRSAALITSPGKTSLHSTPNAGLKGPS